MVANAFIAGSAQELIVLSCLATQRLRSECVANLTRLGRVWLCELSVRDEMSRPLTVLLAVVGLLLTGCSQPQSSRAELIHTGDWSALTPANIGAVRVAGEDLQISLTEEGAARIRSDFQNRLDRRVRVVVAGRSAGRDVLLDGLLISQSLIVPGAARFSHELETALSLADPQGAQIIVELWQVHGSVILRSEDFRDAIWRDDGVTLQVSSETTAAISRLNSAEPLGRWMLIVDDRHLASAPFTLSIAEDRIDVHGRVDAFRGVLRGAVTDEASSNVERGR